MAENSQAVIPDNLILVDGEIGGVPSSSASDAGKVLAVDAEGDPSWVTPSGGTLYTEGNGIEISDQNVVSIDTTVVATKSDLSGLQGELTAGTGIDITNDTISVDTSVIATQNDLSGLQPTLTAGDNISISNNTISATDTTYTAGTGLSLTGTEFAVDTTVIASKSDLPSSDELLPSATSSDEGKVLTIDSQGEAGWATPASVDEVPAVTSNDDGKVLKATYSGGVGSYAWATESGGGGSPSDSVFRAVYGSSTYAEVRAAFTAGKAICLVDGDEDDGVIASDVTFVDEEDKIIFSRGNALNTSNNVRVDYTLARNGTWSTTSVTPRQVPTVTSTDDGKVLTASYSGGTGSFAWTTPSGGSSDVFVWEAGTTTNQEVYDAIAAGKDIFIHAVESGDNVVYRMYKYFLSSGTYFVYSSTYSEQGGTGNTGCMVQCIAYVAQNSNVANYKSQMNVSFITDKTDTYDSTSKKAMSGIAVASAISGVTLASLNTAGITDIQQVASLPANPVATVLYLIPEA